MAQPKLLPVPEVIEGFPISPEAATAKANASGRLAQSQLRPAAAGYTAPLAPAMDADLSGRGPGVNPTPIAGGAPPMPPATPPAAPAGPEPAKSAGWFKRTAAGAGSTLRTGAGFAGGVATAGAGLGVGAAAGAIQREIDARAPQPSPFVAPADAPGQIPVDPNSPRGPAPIQSHPLGFGPDNEFTRNTANTLNAIPGLNGLGAGLRASASAIKGVSGMIPASAKLANVTGRGEQAGQVGAQVVAGAKLGAPELPNLGASAAPTPTAPVGPNPTDQRLAVGTQSAGPGAPGAGNITRVGNSYSGENIGFGATINGVAGGRGGLIKNQPNNDDGSPSTLRGGGTVSSMDFSEGHRQNLLELQRNAAERGSAPQGPVNHGDLSGSWRADTARKNRESSFKNDISSIMNGNMKPRDKRAAMALMYEKYGMEQKLEAEGVNARAGQNNSLRVAEMNNATQRRSNDQNNQTTLRGQNMELEGKTMPARLAAQQRGVMAGIMKQAKDDPAVAQRIAASLGYDPKSFAEQTAALQMQRGTTDKQMRERTDDLVESFRADPRFNTVDPKDPNKTVFNADGAKRAAASMAGKYGDRLAGMSKADKLKAQGEITAEQDLTDRLRQPEKSFMDYAAGVIGQYQKPADNTSLPDLTGATPRRRGITFMSGRDQNDILLTTPGGVEYNAGQLTDAQIKVLDAERKGLR